jgi:recombinational DNA repair ATPase RecF
MAAANGAIPWKRLRQMTFGPFRGFRTPEEFDLQKRIILFYGPNGSGKTSFCEALEWALLGSVEEAENKRIDPRAYLANIHAGRFAAPVLKATDHEQREIDVVADPDAYRFCFVEKNRIDSFSRIAARTAGQRSELIATLFGMDQFNEFVGNFNENMDAQLVLEAAKEKVLSAKQEALVADRETAERDQDGLDQLDSQEAELAGTYAANMSYQDLKTLVGSVEVPGRLHELERILNEIPPAIIGVTGDDLVRTAQAAREIHDEIGSIEAALAERSSQVSFKELYSSVLALQGEEGDHCPACDTPLMGAVRVTTNPYEKARAGLGQLRELADMQERLAGRREDLASAARALLRQMSALNPFLISHGERDSPVGRYLAELPTNAATDWWLPLFIDAEARPGRGVSFDDFLALAERVRVQDAASNGALQERQRNIQERDQLNAFRLKIQESDLKRQQYVETVVAARARITQFDEATAMLVQEVEKERRDIERDTPIKAAYDRFLREIREYRQQLPSSLLAGLNETALTLYNEFNRNDLDADKLAELHLPLGADEKIEIVFRGNPGIRLDALQVLSEGHVRCLGLAILLAKAKSIESPVIVFDDAINAIDHDHRGGIREAIFENGNFLGVQLIVTCHSNEFIKDIQQHLPQAQREDCTVFLFRNHTGDYQPRIKRNVPSRNYIAQARASKDLLNERDALASSRRALEMMTEKTWGFLASHDLGLLNVQLAGAGREPGLRNVCESLHKKLRDANTFAHPSKDPLIAAYGKILGIAEANLVWTYLNKGTHEEADRDDFDAEVVEVVVRTLEELDVIDLRPRR